MTNNIDNITAGSSYSCLPESCKSHTIGPNTPSLKILTQNIRSINKNFPNFEVLLARMDFSCDIYLLTETWNSKVCNYPILKNYETHYTKRNHNQNDGVVAYTKQGINCSVEEYYLNDASCLIIKIDETTVVIGVYRSPSQKNLHNFFTSLDTLLDSVKTFENIILMGDVNIDIKPNNEDRDSHVYLDMLASHGLLAGHQYPTRLDTCLDHAMTKSKLPAVTIVLASPLTDHSGVLSLIDTNNKSVPKTPIIKTTTKINYGDIVEELKNTNFDHILNSIDPNWCAEQLISVLNSSIQSNTLKASTHRRTQCLKPWITPGLVRCIRNRDRMHLKCKREPNNEIIKITYKRYKNFCNDLLKRLKRTYEKNLLEKYVKNPKMKWKIIDTITSRNNKNTPSDDLLKIAKTPEAALEAVNDYFSSIASDLAKTILDKNFHFNSNINEVQPSPVNSMVMIETSEQEIESVLMNLKTDSAVGWDGIPTKLLKLAKDSVVPVITHIANLCVVSGIFPKTFKKAIIHPIYKSGNRECVKNYRPISVLPALSKIIEKIMNKRLLSFLEKESILSNNQFGFRSGRSTAQAVSGLVETVATHIDSKRKCIGVFLDLAKAFDTVSIPKLLHKMENIGIRGTALKLFSDYLHDRTQRVTLNGMSSRDCRVSFGVPQGSVLGPTLFLIYINTLCGLNLKKCDIFAFADDTALIFHGKTWGEARKNTELGLKVIFQWLNENLLTLNVAKTKYLLFSNTVRTLPSTFHLQLHDGLCSFECMESMNCGCDFLERVETIKYLGVLIDEKINWCPQINQLTERTRKLMYIFKKLRHIADSALTKTVYLALCQSIISYCITSWGGACKTYLLKVERAQRSLLKVMTFKPYRHPTAKLYEDCDVLTVRQLFVQELILVQHQKLPFNSSLTQSRRQDRVCPTRQYKTFFINKFQCYLGPMLYNKINKVLNIYSLNRYNCKKVLTPWLKNQNYEETEKLFEILR